MQLSKVLIQMLNEKIIKPINLNISATHKEKIDNFTIHSSPMQENSANPKLDLFINELVSDENLLFTSDSTFFHFKNAKKLNERVLKYMIKAILEIVLQKNSLYDDKARKNAREKINLVSKNDSSELDNINAILLIRFPSNINYSDDSNFFMELEYFNGKKYEEKKKKNSQNIEKISGISPKIIFFIENSKINCFTRDGPEKY